MNNAEEEAIKELMEQRKRRRKLIWGKIWKAFEEDNPEICERMKAYERRA